MTTSLALFEQYTLINKICERESKYNTSSNSTNYNLSTFWCQKSLFTIYHMLIRF